MNADSGQVSSEKPRRRKAKKNGMLSVLITDRIAEAIKTEIDNFVIRTFENFQVYYNRLYHYPSGHAHSVQDQHGNWLGYDKYVFDMYGQEPKNVNVQASKRGKVFVVYAKAWMALEDFLSKLTPPVNIWEPEPSEHLSLDDKTRLWQDQWQWWQRTGKKFRLLDLPTEIRELIYKFALVKKIEAYPHARGRKLLPAHAHSLAKRLPNVKLLKTNRQVYHEAKHILYRDSVFFIEHLFLIEDGLLYKKAMRPNIRKLDLALSHKQFWKLFGFKAGNHNYEPEMSAFMLRKMKLTELTLTMPTPLSASDCKWLQRSCQKTAVDWILESAWPWVKGHPVKLQGSVKTRQRDEFLEKCAAEHAEYLKWCKWKPLGYSKGTLEEYDDEWVTLEDGGVSLEHQEPSEGREGEVPKETPKELPPVCRCSLPCWEHWTPDD